MAPNGQRMLSPGPLLDARGALVEAGYATSLVRRYDRAAIRACGLRIKEWDYYCIIGGDTVLALTIADNSYMGLESVSLIDLGTRWQHTRSFMRLMPLGRTGLPSSSAQGHVAVERPGYALRFDNDGARRELTVRVDDFRDRKPLTARVTLNGAPRDSMVIATPFAGHPRAFSYNQKINCLKAAGEVVFGGETRRFDELGYNAADLTFRELHGVYDKRLIYVDLVHILGSESPEIARTNGEALTVETVYTVTLNHYLKLGVVVLVKRIAFGECRDIRADTAVTFREIMIVFLIVVHFAPPLYHYNSLSKELQGFPKKSAGKYLFAVV